MKINDLLNEGEMIIPQPSAFKVDLSAYEFQALMKEFRAETDVRAKGNNGLVMFYSEYEHDEFSKFLTAKGVNFEDIGKQEALPGNENTASPVAKKKPNRFGV